ncbi:MAG: AI-2E family transporter [Chitinophagaceae bacterium]|nr:MAG: AI-2E family transporter [Chitinophagaceae bacterium]
MPGTDRIQIPLITTMIQPHGPTARQLTFRLFNLLAVIVLMYLLKSILVPLFFSILFSICLYPMATRLEKLKIGKAPAAIISVIFGAIVISAILYFFTKQIISIGSSSGQMIVDRTVSGLLGIEEWLNDHFGIERTEMMTKLQSESGSIAGSVAGFFSGFVGSLGGILANAVIIPIFMIFQIYYRDFFIEFFFRAFRSSSSEKVKETLSKIYTVVQSYLLGLVTVIGIVSVLNTVGLLLLGIEYAWFFGIFASVLLLIPYIGIAIGSIIPALFALATMDSAWYALGVVIWFQVVQFLEGNFITPFIVGGKVSVNPLVSIISLLLGGLLFGLSGVVLAIPLIAVLKVLLDADPATEAFGFLIGEPEKYHLKKYSRLIVLKKWAGRNKPPTPPTPDVHK